MAAMQVTLGNIAPSKLLNYVQKQTLVDFVSPKKYAEVEHRLRQQLDKSKITLKDMKQHLATSPKFIQSLRTHSTGVDAFNKYQQVVERLRGMDHGKAAAVRKVMTQPTQRYKGCLASILQPADYKHCLVNYDDEQFQNIGLVPTALKQRVYDKGDIATRCILTETLTRKTNTISDIPSGYRQFISKNPDTVQRLF
jgi:hypothetical protein